MNCVGERSAADEAAQYQLGTAPPTTPNDPRFYETCDIYGLFAMAETDVESHFQRRQSGALIPMIRHGAYIRRTNRKGQYLHAENHPSITSGRWVTSPADGCNIRRCIMPLSDRRYPSGALRRGSRRGGGGYHLLPCIPACR